MALLTLEKRKAYFKKLGLGEYTKANIEKLQKKYLRAKDVDGIYGVDTDNLLRHVYNCSLFPNFTPEEFKCECGGKYCTGYPSYMKQVELKNLQSIRAHFGKPVEITSGMRCRTYNNSLRGSIPNSRHLNGYAADIYIKDITDTLAGRKAAIKWIKTLPNHKYSYCNGYDSNGVKYVAGYMGASIHTECSKPKTTVKLATSANVAPKIKFNKGKKNVYLTDAELKKWLDTVKKQYEWSKNSVYHWVDPPTVENSKTKSTCISLHSVSMQRLGILPKGGYFYLHPTKKVISGNRKEYVKKHTELFKVFYPNKSVPKMIKSGQIQIGDMVGYSGKGYHSMIYMGYKTVKKNGKNVITPLFATMGHTRGYNRTYKSYANRKVGMVVRLKKISK